MDQTDQPQSPQEPPLKAPATWSERKALRAAADIRIRELEAKADARNVAGKSIGKYGLAYITAILLAAIVASKYLSTEALSAIMAPIGGALTAIIAMLQGIAGTREEPPEIEIIRSLVTMVDRIAADKDNDMTVDVDRDKVSVQRRGNLITSARPHQEPANEQP